MEGRDNRLQYARVIVDISHTSIDRTFEYRVPDEMIGQIQVGDPVLIPFGRGDRTRCGFVVGLSETCAYTPDKIKELYGRQPGAFPVEARLIALADHLHQKYGGTMNDALRTVLPVREKVKEKVERSFQRSADLKTLEAALAENERKKYHARARLLTLLCRQENIGEAELQEEKISASVLAWAQEAGFLLRMDRRVIRGGEHPLPLEQRPILTTDQEAACRGILAAYQEDPTAVCLLHGVTGSGKTEVYFHIIDHVLAAGKQVICLIPEIALTYQTMRRFIGRFGERIALLHSRLSKGERFDQIERITRGEADILVGPRSALFAPFSNLGLIIMDEEHESSYKSEKPPRYHAREVAIWRAKQEGAGVLLGSATPSLESYARARAGEYHLFTLPERAHKQPLPQVHVVDMKEEMAAKNYSIFSRLLKQKMEAALSAGKQVMLFLNRRGYAGFVSCRSCGYVVKCPHCDVSMTLHLDGTLHCHYCGYIQPMPEHCPSCGSPYLAAFGLGTQKAEMLTRQEFPGYRVLRMDLDTTSHKEGHRQILEQFARGEADILLGTQMIVKGHDFPNVAVVGILAADLSLWSADYASAERTFQLVCQAAGRAGRGREPGEAVVQTYHPDHYSILSAARQDYETFFEQEMAVRQTLGYPPAGHLLAILLVSRQEQLVLSCARQLATLIPQAQEKEKGFVLLGPSGGAYGKLKDNYRQVLYVKHRQETALIRLRETLTAVALPEGVRMSFDLDPITVY